MKTMPFDATEYLNSPAAIAAYINDAIENGGPDELIAALGTVARAKGMTQIARESGLGRESLYKALTATANPSLVTVQKVFGSLGLRLSASPLVRSNRRRQQAQGHYRGKGLLKTLANEKRRQRSL